MTRLPYPTTLPWTETAKAMVMDPQNVELPHRTWIAVAENLAREYHESKVAAVAARNAMQRLATRRTIHYRFPVGTRVARAIPTTANVPLRGVVIGHDDRPDGWTRVRVRADAMFGGEEVVVSPASIAVV